MTYLALIMGHVELMCKERMALVPVVDKIDRDWCRVLTLPDSRSQGGKAVAARVCTVMVVKNTVVGSSC